MPRHLILRYHFVYTLGVLPILSSCGRTTEGTGGSADPWTLQNAEPVTSEGIRVLVLHDMEGLSGQDDPRSFDFGTEQYPFGQELLVADVNAVVDGLFAAGATEVHVVDGHGSGNPDPDILGDKLDSRAEQVFRDEQFDTYFDLVEPGAYDAVAVVGMHAKTGSGGFASHTYTLGMDFVLNGRSITETELVALSWGRVGVPVIFASGDDRLAQDLATMPWIQYVTVKRATSASTAEPRPMDEARADLREGARRAVDILQAAKVMKVITPITTTLRAVPPASLRVLDGVPGIQYADNSVTFVANDLRDAYDGLQELVNVARVAYLNILMEQLRDRRDWQEIRGRFRNALDERWLDYESGRWEPEERAGDPKEPRQYHGYR